jgi:hypothetical protein
MAETSSNARIFFEDLFSDPAKTFEKINQLVTEPADENEWREFKGVDAWSHAAGPDKERKTRELQNIWSQAIGAFANALGGVLIWGIHAPNKFAERRALANDAEKLAELLSGWVNAAVIPSVSGIQILPVKENDSKRGCVVCLIPASRYAPHQSRWPEPQFYLRCQDGSHVCGYTELKRLFEPKVSPIYDLEATARVSYLTSDKDALTTSVTAQIRNIGHGSGSDLVAVLQGNACFHRCRGWGLSSDLKTLYLERNLHPGQQVGISFKSDALPLPGDPKQNGFELTLIIYSNNARPFEFRFQLSATELTSRLETARDQDVPIVLIESL